MLHVFYVVCHSVRFTRDESGRLSHLREESGKIRAKLESAHLTLKRCLWQQWSWTIYATRRLNWVLWEWKLISFFLFLPECIFRILFTIYNICLCAALKRHPLSDVNKPNMEEKHWMKMHIHSLTVELKDQQKCSHNPVYKAGCATFYFWTVAYLNISNSHSVILTVPLHPVMHVRF